MTESEKQSRREYQRKYYQAHKEQAKAYQRVYAQTHKHSSQRGRGRKFTDIAARVVGKGKNFNRSDLMNAPTDKAVKMFNAILRGEAAFAR